MATPTLLTMVQDILSRMSSDEVNSISDTTESMQIATILKNKYYDIVSRGDLEIDRQLFQLTASNNNSQPTLMTLPAGVTTIAWLQYYDSNPLDNTQTGQFGAFSHGLNTDIVSSVAWTTTSATSNSIGMGNKTFTVTSSTLPVVIGQGAVAISGTNSMFGNVVSYVGTTLVINVVSTIGSGTFSNWVIQNSNFNSIPGYKHVDIVPIDYLLDITNRFDVTQNNVLTYTFTEGGYNFTFKYKNDHTPSMCAILANNFVLFDMFDNTQDTTLQQVKTLGFGEIVPPFTLSDTYVPNLNDNQFPLFFNEALAVAFVELKQMPNPKAEQETKRQWAVTQKGKSIGHKPSEFDRLANFGRVPRTGGYGGYPLYRWMRGGVGSTMQ